MRKCGLIVGVAICCGLVGAGCSKSSELTPATPQPDAPKASVTQPKAETPPKAAPTPPQATESEAVAVLRAYIVEPKWQDRVKFVRSGERVRPYMQEMYAKNYKPFQNENIRLYPAEPKPVSVGGWASLTAEWDDIAYGRKQSGEYIVFRTRDGYKVDWEATLGHNPTRLPVFVAKRGDDPTSFRVSCKLSNYHNYEYKDTKSTHYSVESQADGKRIHGYVPRKSAAGERIYSLLQDGQAHQLVLQFQHIGPLGESMKDSNSQGEMVTITKLVSDSWVLSE